MKKVLITGITGQDGSYLAEFLLNKGYEVHGIVQRHALEKEENHLSRIAHILDKLKLHSGDITIYNRMLDLFDEIQPDECYHLAAQSFVGVSFKDPFTTFRINFNGTHNIIEALRKKAPKCKLYFAATSEMFGKVQEIPQKETTRYYPRSPYGVSKVAGFDMVRLYRESYGLFMCSGILFNHESPRRGHEFVTRKITQHVAKMKKGTENVLVLGNIDAKRDWGYAGDYIEAMWLMLQQEKAEDFVIGSGQNHSVRSFVDAAFKAVGLQYEIVDLHDLPVEIADARVKELKQMNDKLYVVQHSRFYRPAEVDTLLADPTKAKEKLGWFPKTSFPQLVSMMVHHDLESV